MFKYVSCCIWHASHALKSIKWFYLYIHISPATIAITITATMSHQRWSKQHTWFNWVKQKRVKIFRVKYRDVVFWIIINLIYPLWDGRCVCVVMMMSKLRIIEIEMVLFSSCIGIQIWRKRLFWSLAFTLSCYHIMLFLRWFHSYKWLSHRVWHFSIEKLFFSSSFLLLFVDVAIIIYRRCEWVCVPFRNII